MKNLRNYILGGLLLLTFGLQAQITPFLVKQPSAHVLAQGDFLPQLSYQSWPFTEDTTLLNDQYYGNLQLALYYGVSDRIQLSIASESWRKTYSGDLKMVLYDDHSLHVTAYTSIHLNSELSVERYPYMKFFDRLSYCSQLIINKPFGNSWELQITPTFVRQNLVWEKLQNHNQWAIGTGLTRSFSENWSVSAEYTFHLNRHADSIYENPWGIGVNYTGDHFLGQFSVSNGFALNGPGVISNSEGELYMGVRVGWKI